MNIYKDELIIMITKLQQYSLKNHLNKTQLYTHTYEISSGYIM
jgi:hypothetical protein